MTKTGFTSASWIWLSRTSNGPHQYACFRKTFDLKGSPGKATLLISTDSDFIAYLNGVEVGRGQFSDYPERKTFSRLNVRREMRRGRNVLAVLVYYRGEDFAEYRVGAPRLMAELRVGDRVVAATDNSWRCLTHPAFRPGPMPRVTPQMGFTTEFDARRDFKPFGFQDRRFNDSRWRRAEVVGGEDDGATSLSPRPVPPLRIEPPVRVRVVTHGDFIRPEAPGSASIAELVSLDALTARPAWEVFTNPELAPSLPYTPDWPRPTHILRQPDGRFLELRPPAKRGDGRFFIVDLGREEVGLLTFRVDAPAGAVFDIAHGEHLDDGRVRAFPGGRCFADRYICKAGVQEYTLPFRRLGARFIEVHVSNFTKPVRFDYVGLRPLLLELDTAGVADGTEEPRQSFSADPLAQRAYDIGVRTLRLCMHEHYEDCPWREQALYAFDSRNQALYGYYAFGNYPFAAASFDLLGNGFRPHDGLLELCAPARLPVTIPIFSLVWMTELADHWLHSGSPDLFKKWRGQIVDMLGRIYPRREPSTGLYRLPEGGDMWQFYEWMDGLAGTYGKDNPAGRFDAPYNLFLHESLGSVAWMLERSGARAEASELRKRQKDLGVAVRRNFWSDRQGAFATYLHAGKQMHWAQLVQCQAMKAGIIPRGSVDRVVDALRTASRPGASMRPMTLSSMLYLVLGLMDQSPAARQLVSESISANWDPMVYAGATSFWETQLGGDDFYDAGSLCHGWSALPVYYYKAFVLGVRPLDPGFKRFSLRPYPDRFARAAGIIPTPAGPITVAWRRDVSGLILDARGPRTLHPELHSFAEAPITKATWNGKRIVTAKSRSREEGKEYLHEGTKTRRRS